MTSGACLCGKYTIRHEGEPQLKAICHCNDCRKISGSMYSTNLFVGADTLKAEPSDLKQYSKPTDAGNTITSYFCDNCGTTLWRESTGLPGVKIVKEGVLEKVSGGKPAVEFYASRRADWVPQITGADQKEEPNKAIAVGT
ncbi:hypothetical protein LARI1_G003563 [Lachnellula arida]|uniref:CENP-V/GFA domain-containing protein n=1 Tax=Lachnellula arida TaxID=1316785 RepID=A0A8T9BLQ7_9HELO|nr:hypothetical protein LARI1_G003563 [Lachnellula arida]